MRYSISKVERILGISQSTLRRYEEAGILRVRRLSGSKYRYFSMGDIARLSVFLGMRKQSFLPHELGENANREDELTRAYRKISHIDSEIKRLEAEKVCWEKHLQLCKLLRELKEQPDDGILHRFGAMVGSYFFDEQSMYDAVFFQMLREGAVEKNYFRLCCFYSQAADGSDGFEYRQAYCMPLELVNEADIPPIKHRIFLPERECIAAYAPNLSIIDEETEGAGSEAARIVRDKTKRLLSRFGREQEGDAMTVTVNVSKDRHEAILLVPVKDAALEPMEQRA